jgi:CTP synthase
VEKIAHFCQVETEQVVVVRDMPSIYQVPILLEQQGLIPLLQNTLHLDQMTIPQQLSLKGQQTWNSWKSLTMGPEHKFYEPVEIALVGKYTEFHDSYTSVIKALEHCAMACRRALKIRWIDSEHLEQSEKDSGLYHKAWHDVCTADGILVPGGFGVRGTEGMIGAARYARENNRPYLGICLGMQIAVIEYARNVCGFKNATSAEFLEKQKTSQRDSAIPTPVESSQPQDGLGKASALDLDSRSEHPVIAFMPEIDPKTLGGTMRLGLRRTMFQPGSEWSKMRKLYGEQDVIRERHRHRYEVNPEYIDRIQGQEAGGLHFVGKDSKGTRMEVVEIKEHPWFVGVQFHPEYLSRVLDPSPPYLGLVAASAGCLDEISELQVKKAKENGGNGVQTIQGF